MMASEFLKIHKCADSWILNSLPGGSSVCVYISSDLSIMSTGFSEFC